MASHTIKTKNMTGNIELFELELTKAQLIALSTMLPRGFTLETVPKSTTSKDSGARPTKKLFTNEGNQVVRKSPKQAETPREDILINKQALRDPRKRKMSTYLDYDYPHHPEATTSTSSKSSKVNAEAVRKCQSVLQKLKKHRYATPFLRPVDVKGLGLRDYYQIVKEPMDISTVENKLKGGKYNTVEQFSADIRKIWNNALLYNMKGSHVYMMALEMGNFFDKIEHDVEHVGFNDSVKDLEKKVEMLSRQISQLGQKGLSPFPESTTPKQKPSSKSSKVAKLMEKPLNDQEKRYMTESIPKLAPEHLRGVWEIVSQRMNLSGQEELEFDIETLPISVARELEKYVKNKMSLINRAKNKGKAKESTPKEMQQSTSFAALKQHEGDFEPISKGEDEITTQHHSVLGSDEKLYSKELNKGDASPSNSSESSFISDSDVEDDDKQLDKNSQKAANSLQKEQEIANFFAGGHGSMLNSFIVK